MVLHSADLLTFTMALNCVDDQASSELFLKRYLILYSPTVQMCRLEIDLATASAKIVIYVREDFGDKREGSRFRLQPADSTWLEMLEKHHSKKAKNQLLNEWV